MPQINKIISKLEDHYDILDFLYKNYPNILDEWKSGLREPTPNPDDNADTNSSFVKQRGDDIP
jgi:hypothetical protein